MADDRTQPATPAAHPLVTGEFVPESSADAGGTRVTPPRADRPPGDLPDVPGYAVTGEIARGGMGRVLAACDLGFGREVAVKVLLRPDPGAARRFVREAEITGRLAHPGIPPAHQLGTLPNGSPFLAMKLIRGRTLADLLAHDRPDLGELLRTFEDVCQAVAYAHDRRVIHRDLKPANVMVGAFGEVQVMDWGLAFGKDEGGRMKDEENLDPDGDSRSSSSFILPPSSLTQAGAVMGTPAYMAPEQARGEDVGAPADVFALGGVLCEVLTGRRTFAGKSSAEAVKKAAAGDVADAVAALAASGADRELIDLATRCLRPDAGARPADGTAVAAELAAYRAGVEERLRTAERERAAAEARAAEQRKRRKVQLALAAAVVLLVAGTGAVAAWRIDEDGTKRAEAVRVEGEGRERERAERDRRERAADAVAGLLDQARAGLEAGKADRAEPFLDQADRRAADSPDAPHAARRADYRAALAALRALVAVDDFRWTPIGTADSDYPPWGAVAGRWEAALAGYGIAPGTAPPAEVAARVNASPIRRALLDALDPWHVSVPPARGAEIRAVLDAADPDPFRTEARRLMGGATTPPLPPGAAARLTALAARPEWDVQPAGLLNAYADARAVSVRTRRDVLARVAARRTGEFAVLMSVASSYPIRIPEWVTERLRWHQAAAAADPTRATAFVGLGVALIEAKSYPAAAAAMKEAIRLGPDDPLSWSNLGVALLGAGDAAGAEAACRKAIRLDPRHLLARYGLASVLLDRKDAASAAEAEAVCRDALRIDPSFSHAHINLGRALSRRGDRAGATAAYREAIRLDPGSANAYFNLGVILSESGDRAGAVAAYREAIRLDPARAETRYNLALVLQRGGDRAAATAEFRAAVQANPAHAEARSSLGLNLLVDGDPAGAEAELREAVRLQPTLGIARLNLGHVFRQKGDHAAAVAEYREAARLAPQLPYPHYFLGLGLRATGDLDGAAAAFAESLRIDPKDATALNALGDVLERKGDLAAAAAQYRNALRVDPKYAAAHVGLGDVARKEGRLDAAEAAYRAALALLPKYPAAEERLAFTLRLKRGEVPTAPPPQAVKPR